MHGSSLILAFLGRWGLSWRVQKGYRTFMQRKSFCWPSRRFQIFHWRSIQNHRCGRWDQQAKLFFAKKKKLKKKSSTLWIYYYHHFYFCIRDFFGVSFWMLFVNEILVSNSFLMVYNFFFLLIEGLHYYFVLHVADQCWLWISCLFIALQN